MDDIALHAPLPLFPELVRAVDEGVACDLGGELDISRLATHAHYLAGTQWGQWPAELTHTRADPVGRLNDSITVLAHFYPYTETAYVF